MPEAIRLTVNGTQHALEVGPDRTLLSVIREELGLTGTRYGCGEAQCGACTVLVDGKALRSCVTPVSTVAGKEILTIESLAGNGKLQPVQEAFIEQAAMQCGYCTSGFIMSCVALLNRNPNPSVEEIRSALAGSICRCGTYQRIIRAVQAAAGKMRPSGGAG